MGIEALRAALEAEGRARVARIREEADARVETLRAQAEAETARQREARLGSERSRRRREAAERVAEARSAAARRILEARAALLDAVFARAAERLPRALDTPEGREALLDRARDALAAMPPGPATVAASPDAAPRLEAVVAERPDTSLASDPDLPAGFRVTGADGALVVDGTLAKRLELERPRLAIGVLARLARDESAEAAR